MSQDKDTLKIRNTAQLKVMNLLAKREHSEKELREKLTAHFSKDENLSGADFVDEIIEEAVQTAKDRKWLPDASDASERVAEALHLKNKGICYINSYLAEKGLPEVRVDSAREMAKAQLIIKSKFADNDEFSEADKARVARLLTSRGFDSETVGKVLYEKF